MKKKTQTTDPKRRSFLQQSVTTAAIAVSVPAVAVAETLSGAEHAVQQDPAGANKTKAGYQLSQHVLDYYKSCMR